VAPKLLTFPEHPSSLFLWEKEMFEDTKGVIRSRNSNKDRQHIGQKKKDKRTNNDLQNITQESKVRATSPGGELRLHGRVGISCPIVTSVVLLLNDTNISVRGNYSIHHNTEVKT